MVQVLHDPIYIVLPYFERILVYGVMQDLYHQQPSGGIRNPPKRTQRAEITKQKLAGCSRATVAGEYQALGTGLQNAQGLCLRGLASLVWVCSMALIVSMYGIEWVYVWLSKLRSLFGSFVQYGTQYLAIHVSIYWFRHVCIPEFCLRHHLRGLQSTLESQSRDIRCTPKVPPPRAV